MQSGNPTCRFAPGQVGVPPSSLRTWLPSVVELSIMFSQAMQFSGGRAARAGAGGDAQCADGLGHVGEILIEHGRQHQPGVANLVGNRRAVQRSG